jgi:hemerythrin-like metal-binding protein
MLQGLDDLERAVHEKRPLRLAFALSQFKSHALEHLVTEENIMRTSDYPRMAEHLGEHDVFRNMLNALQYSSVRQELYCGMVEDLAYWLIHHVVHSDRDYAAHLGEA